MITYEHHYANKKLLFDGPQGKSAWWCPLGSFLFIGGLDMYLDYRHESYLKLTISQKMLYQTLFNIAYPGNKCWPSYGQLAKLTGLHRRSCISIMGFFLAKGFIKRTARMGQQSNIYELTSWIRDDGRKKGGDRRSPGVVIYDHQGGDPGCTKVVIYDHPEVLDLKESIKETIEVDRAIPKTKTGSGVRSQDQGSGPLKNDDETIIIKGCYI